MSQAREKHKLKKQIAEYKSNVKSIADEIKRIESVATLLAEAKTFSPVMLGQGHIKGGFKHHKKNRYNVLERIRRIGNLTDAQNGQWEFFKESWDDAQASEHGANWGNIFSEVVNDVLGRMMGGDEPDAFSKFVKSETDRVLGSTGALVAPGFPTSTK